MTVSLKLFGTDDNVLRTEIEENNTTIASLQAKTTDLNKTVDKLATVDKLYSSGISFSQLVPKIGSILPEGTILNGLSLTGESTDTLLLDMNLQNPELAAVLIKNLVESDLFEAADISNINPIGVDGDRYRYATSVSVSFEGSAAAKKKALAAAQVEAAKKAEEAAKSEAQ